jgi:hypothetical protein
MIEDSAVVEERAQFETKLARTVLRMLAHRALLKACEGTDAASGNALESIRRTVLDKKLAATVRVQFPLDADVFFEEIERMLTAISQIQGGSSTGNVGRTQS